MPRIANTMIASATSSRKIATSVLDPLLEAGWAPAWSVAVAGAALLAAAGGGAGLVTAMMAGVAASFAFATILMVVAMAVDVDPLVVGHVLRIGDRRHLVEVVAVVARRLGCGRRPASQVGRRGRFGRAGGGR